jgi:Transposase
MVKVAALDPFRGYASALRTSLPHATMVLDAFHVSRLGLACVDEVRRRVQQDSTGHRGRKHDPLFRIRRLLRRRSFPIGSMLHWNALPRSHERLRGARGAAVLRSGEGGGSGSR